MQELLDELGKDYIGFLDIKDDPKSAVVSSSILTIVIC
jgi:hypothetical protein